MQTASIQAETKKDSSSTSVIDIDELPESFFDYFTWSKRAICAGVQISMFFTASSVGMAKVICGRCPVKAECLIWSLMYKEQGIWGGTTENERKKLLPYYNVQRYIKRAVQLGFYYPKPTAQQVHENLKANFPQAS